MGSEKSGGRGSHARSSRKFPLWPNDGASTRHPATWQVGSCCCCSHGHHPGECPVPPEVLLKGCGHFPGWPRCSVIVNPGAVKPGSCPRAAGREHQPPWLRNLGHPAGQASRPNVLLPQLCARLAAPTPPEHGFLGGGLHPGGQGPVEEAQTLHRSSQEAPGPWDKRPGGLL